MHEVFWRCGSLRLAVPPPRIRQPSLCAAAPRAESARLWLSSGFRMGQHPQSTEPASTAPNAPVRLRMADLTLAPRERQTWSPHRILHGFQLGHFVPMYGYCFQVVCIRACSNTVLAWQSLTFSRLSSAFGKSPCRCHRYFIGSYNDRAKQGVREMVGTEAAEAAF